MSVHPRLVLATRNPGKVVELGRILGAAGLRVELLGVDAFPDVPDVRETGITFAENALLKAAAVAARVGLPAVADDSGLCVDAMSGMPGIFSARWAGRHGDDRANLDLLLAQLADVPDERRTAEFRCAVVLAVPTADGEVAEHAAEGLMSGRVIRELRGENGFGYDVLFCADGYDVTTAELPSAEKDAISHRGKALRAIAPVVVEQCGHWCARRDSNSH